MNMCNCVVSKILHIMYIRCVIFQTLIVRYIMYVIECIFYLHCPYAVVASRSMAIVVDPQLKLIMFLFLSCNVLCSQCSLSP